MLYVVCNGMVWIGGGPYAGVVAVGYYIWRIMGLVTKQNVFQADAVSQSDKDILQLCNPRVWSFGTGISTGLPDVRFVITAFEICCKFSESLYSLRSKRSCSVEL